jgi:hypothetical protein
MHAICDKGNYILQTILNHDKWGPVTTAWRFLRLRMEERPPKWWVAANVLSWAADKVGVLQLGGWARC